MAYREDGDDGGRHGAARHEHGHGMVEKMADEEARKAAGRRLVHGDGGGEGGDDGESGQKRARWACSGWSSYILLSSSPFILLKYIFYLIISHFCSFYIVLYSFLQHFYGTIGW